MDNEPIQGAAHLEIVNINSVCRLCANQKDKLISIFSDEGVTHDLANKINMHLPVRVSDNDELPLQCCWDCVSTLLTFDDLLLTCVEADQRFRTGQLIGGKHMVQHITFEAAEEITNDHNDGMELEPLSTSLNDFCQAEPPPAPDDDKKPMKQYKNKRKPPLMAFYPQEPTNSLETYISDIEQHFIVDTNLETNTDSLGEYKIDIEDANILAKEEKKLGEDIVIEEDSRGASDNETESSRQEEEKVYACPYCSAVFVLKCDVTNHICVDHKGKECLSPIAQPVPDQKVKAERRKNNKIDQDVINAAKVVVDGRIYYNCKECGKNLHSPYTYVWHMRIHTGERPYVCDLCGKQFRVSQGLVRHLRETHQGIKKFPCDLCGRMFATRRNVEEHRRIHTNERPYICDLCGKAFKQKASLFVHKRSHKNYFPFKCSYCNQGFRTKPPLLVHITRHTGEKPYKCDTCGRSFRIKYELKRHKLIHSDEKPFVCSLCGLSFRQKRYLRNHMKSNHTLVTS